VHKGSFPNARAVPGDSRSHCGGENGFSLPIAQALDAEIINVDSRQLYRYMDIGTAKPSMDQQAQVAHHLLDLSYRISQVTPPSF
jgi:tRNA dimethylallyltransferase